MDHPRDSVSKFPNQNSLRFASFCPGISSQDIDKFALGLLGSWANSYDRRLQLSSEFSFSFFYLFYSTVMLFMWHVFSSTQLAPYHQLVYMKYLLPSFNRHAHRHPSTVTPLFRRTSREFGAPFQLSSYVLTSPLSSNHIILTASFFIPLFTIRCCPCSSKQAHK